MPGPGESRADPTEGITRIDDLPGTKVTCPTGTKVTCQSRNSLFDRRCRKATALTKPTRLRARLRRFGRLRTVLKKLFAPVLEKALVCLDEELLGVASYAVERGNWRYRKMQKTVYRARTRGSIEVRMTLDLRRERQAPGRDETTKILHKASGSFASRVAIRGLRPPSDRPPRARP
jgi:hypothetical protein